MRKEVEPVRADRVDDEASDVVGREHGAPEIFGVRRGRTDGERHRTDKQIGRDAWLAAGKSGFLGFMMPEQFGGGGVTDFRFNAVLGEELARLGYGYASAFGINVDVVSPFLRDLTTEDRRARWIPRFCAGR